MKRANRMASLVVAGTLGLSAFGANPEVPSVTLPDVNLENKVRHELLMLPFFNVFEDLSYQVRDGVVTLGGKVIQPTTRQSAEAVVKRIAGVKAVDNQIEVLPLSNFDDRIRVATLNAVYGFAPLQRYGLGAQPSIRILVKNGNITLAGAVRTAVDRDLAFLRANGVSGAFSVTNEIRVDSD